MTKVIKKIIKFILPLLLGGFVLYWVYCDLDFAQVGEVLKHGMKWEWMVLSLFWGVLAQLIRGWRWKQTLEPLALNPRTRTTIDAIFVSYAANLIVPRIGEVSRCGVLKKYDKISFSQSFGTVVTERLLDAVCMILVTAIAFLVEMDIFLSFFQETGTKFSSFSHLFSSVWFYISVGCFIAGVYLIFYMMKTFSFFSKVKGAMVNVMGGIASLKKIKNCKLFVFYTISLWVCYFLHFYLTFYCFDFTANMGWQAGLVMFVAGTIAVIVPTPNGAGPWHFAVITMMMLYGVNATNAAIFALIVHTIQTFLVALLGIYGLVSLLYTKPKI